MDKGLEVEVEGNLIPLSEFREQRESMEAPAYSKKDAKSWKEFSKAKRILLLVFPVGLILIITATFYSHHQAQGLSQEAVTNLEAQISHLSQKIEQQMQYVEFTKQAVTNLQNQIGNHSSTVNHGMKDLAERTVASTNEATDILQEKITNLTEAILQETNQTGSINEKMNGFQTQLSTLKLTFLQELNKTAQAVKPIFTHGLTYKITSVAHGGRLHVPSVLSDRIQTFLGGVRIHLREDQTFLFTTSDNGWRLTAIPSEGDRKVLDQDIHTGKIRQLDLNLTHANQEWIFKPMTNDSSVYQILSVFNWKAITSFKIDEDAMCYDTREWNTNTNQLWTIERV